jgi:hypothetical protein
VKQLFEVTIPRAVKCDICMDEDAKYDGKTKRGPWGYMCQGCFDIHGVGIGLGKGQKLIVTHGK